MLPMRLVFTDLVKLSRILHKIWFLRLGLGNLMSIQPRIAVVVPSADNARLSALHLCKCKWDDDPVKGSALPPLIMA